MSPILEPDELARITGYRQPAAQLAELHRQGFYRARKSPTSASIILERAHYDAVCAGSNQQARPKVRIPQLKAA